MSKRDITFDPQKAIASGQTGYETKMLEAESQILDGTDAAPHLRGLFNAHFGTLPTPDYISGLVAIFVLQHPNGHRIHLAGENHYGEGQCETDAPDTMNFWTLFYETVKRTAPFLDVFIELEERDHEQRPEEGSTLIRVREKYKPCMLLHDQGRTSSELCPSNVRFHFGDIRYTNDPEYNGTANYHGTKVVSIIRKMKGDPLTKYINYVQDTLKQRYRFEKSSAAMFTRELVDYIVTFACTYKLDLFSDLLAFLQTTFLPVDHPEMFEVDELLREMLKQGLTQDEVLSEIDTLDGLLLPVESVIQDIYVLVRMLKKYKGFPGSPYTSIFIGGVDHLHVMKHVLEILGFEEVERSMQVGVDQYQCLDVRHMTRPLLQR